MDIELTGIKELTKQLNDLGEKGSRLAIRAATKQAMDDVRKEAKINAYAHGLKNKGTLIRSIKTKSRSKRVPGGYYYRATVGFTGDGFYGSFFENGAKHLDEVKPMILPAFEKYKPVIPKYFEDALEFQIRRVAAKSKR